MRATREKGARTTVSARERKQRRTTKRGEETATATTAKTLGSALADAAPPSWASALRNNRTLLRSYSLARPSPLGQGLLLLRRRRKRGGKRRSFFSSSLEPLQNFERKKAKPSVRA